MPRDIALHLLQQFFDPIGMVNGTDKRCVFRMRDNHILHSYQGNHVPFIFRYHNIIFTVEQFMMSGNKTIIISISFDDVGQCGK